MNCHFFLTRENYKSYIKHTKKVFSANIEDSYRSVERSKWLAGPDFLHKTVKNFRDLDNLPTKPFMEWLGIQQSLTQISGGTTDIVNGIHWTARKHLVLKYDMLVWHRSFLIKIHNVMILNRNAQ